MWNMVQMENGQWYLVDATWDDQASGVYTTYFLAGSESAGFNGKTVGQDHMAVGDFTGVGYEPFALPTLSADAYSADVEKEKPLTEIQLDQENLSLHHGESAVLSVTYLPTDSTEEKSVVWTTSDEEVATVDENGTVIAGDKAGTAEITAVSSVNEELTASCEVTVEHIEGEWEVVDEPTCTEEGSREKKCIRCMEVLDTEPVDALGHEAGEWEVVDEPTCTEAGSRERRCTECDEVLDTEEIPAAGHKAGAWEVTEEATCTESGEEEQSCEECGELLNTRKISATGHQFGSYQVVKKATVLAKGIKARTCTLCGKEQTVSLPKLTAQISTSKKTLKVKKGAKVSFPKVKYGQGDSIKSYKSNKPSIATVDKKGKITGVKPGTAVITVTLASKKKASVTVTVSNPTKKLSVNKKTFSLKEGKSAQSKVSVTPKDSSDKVVYKSSDEKVATVNQKGKITAKKKGTALITITSGSKKIVCRVTVKKK